MSQTWSDFFEKHKTADIIEVMQADGRPVKAEYHWANGLLRETPAVYWYPEF